MIRRIPTLLAVVLVGSATFAAADPLPSWRETGTKQAIIDFVEKVTREGTADFVPVAERIATFDNDGTLWAEQPMYFSVVLCARPNQSPRAAASRVG
jgi:hypothetical protein